MHPDTLDSRRRLYLLGRLVVSRHYRKPLTLAAVAKALATSPRQLQRAYAQFEDSFHEDLLGRRMSVAAQLLVDQQAIPIVQVARLVGYRQGPAFAKAFRRRYGLSPHVFRRQAARHRLKRDRDDRPSPQAVSNRLERTGNPRARTRPAESRAAASQIRLAVSQRRTPCDRAARPRAG